MKSLRIIAVLAAASFILASVYGLYVLVVCQNHTLAHSFVGNACPRTDFLTYLMSWRQTFIWIVRDVAALLVIAAASYLLMKRAGRRDPTSNRGRGYAGYYSRTREAEKPLHSFIEFLHQGKLHPEIYAE